MTLCRVQEPDGRHGIEADGVEAIRGHRGEISLDYVGLGYLGSVRPRSERSVGHAADVELAIVGVEVPPADGRSALGRRGSAAGDAEATARALEEAGARARPTVGDDDPLLALHDALATYPADRILVFDDGLASEARERFDVPVSHGHLR